MIIHECHRILATPNGASDAGEGGGGEGVREGESVAGAALLALQMIETALEKQDQFFSIVRQVRQTYQCVCARVCLCMLHCTLYMYMEKHVYSILAKKRLKPRTNQVPHTKHIYIIKQTNNERQDPGCPALRTGAVG